MTCKNHKDRQSVFVCTVCGEALCSECAIELEKAVYCKECLENIVSEKSAAKAHKKSWLMAICLSLVPGTGHMYLGLVKKGLTLMSLLFSLILLTILFSESSGMYWLSGFLIPTLSFLFLSYSIFDCLSLTDRVNAGEDLADQGIYELVLLRDMVRRRRGLFSLLLIFAGGIAIINVFSKFIGELIKRYIGISFSLAGLLFAVFLVILGLYLLREGRR
jgi:hypothetical protein